MDKEYIADLRKWTKYQCLRDYAMTGVPEYVKEFLEYHKKILTPNTGGQSESQPKES